MTHTSRTPSIAPSQTFKNHWWRPEWANERQMYTFYLTFEHDQDLASSITSHYSSALDSPNLNKIPAQWLHISVQHIGFADEVPDDQLRRVANDVKQRCAAMQSIRISVGSPVVAEEGVALRVRPAELLISSRKAIREVVANVRGPNLVPGGTDFSPHVTLAYAHFPGDTQPTSKNLEALEPQWAASRFQEFNLARLWRADRLYKWETMEYIRLGS